MTQVKKLIATLLIKTKLIDLFKRQMYNGGIVKSKNLKFSR